MEKKFFNFIFAIGLCAMLLSMTQFVSAKDFESNEITAGTANVYGNVSIPNYNENVNVSTTVPGTAAVTKGTSAPNSLWNWNNGNCVISGNTSNTNLYSNYLFSDKSILNIGFTIAYTNITIELWQKDAGFLWTDKKVSNLVISAIWQEDIGKVTRIGYFNGLNKSAKYYIKIIAPARFQGYII